MISIGLIGCGAWGWRYVNAAAESGIANVTWSTLPSLSVPDARALLANTGIVSSANWRSLLAKPVDAFIVATPPDTHEEICTELLAAGRPVMCRNRRESVSRSSLRCTT